MVVVGSENGRIQLSPFHLPQPNQNCSSSYTLLVLQRNASEKKKEMMPCQTQEREDSENKSSNT